MAKLSLTLQDTVLHAWRSDDDKMALSGLQPTLLKTGLISVRDRAREFWCCVKGEKSCELRKSLTNCSIRTFSSSRRIRLSRKRFRGTDANLC